MSSSPGRGDRDEQAAAITRDEFERGYAERSGMTVEELRGLGQVVVRCYCDEDGCEGWAMVSREAAKDYEPGGIYGPRCAKSPVAGELAGAPTSARSDSAAQMSPLDRLATWWLVRRGRLLDLKPRPLRIEIPSNLSAEEAEKLREEWTRLHAR